MTKAVAAYKSNRAKLALAKEEFIARNLIRSADDPAYTLKQVAEQYDLSYGYVRLVAAKEEWSAELSQRMDVKLQKVQQDLSAISEFNEIEVRIRQATYARTASTVAMRRIEALLAEKAPKISIKDAIELLKLGLSEERSALGISDSKGAPSPDKGDQPILTDSQVFQVARQIVDLRRNQETGVYEKIEG